MCVCMFVFVYVCVCVCVLVTVSVLVLANGRMVSAFADCENIGKLKTLISKVTYVEHTLEIEK